MATVAAAADAPTVTITLLPSAAAGGDTSVFSSKGWSLLALGSIVGSAAGAVYLCYKVRHARAEAAAAQAHARVHRRQPLGARTTDALLSSWRAAHLVGLKADEADQLRHLTPDELAAKEYKLPRRRSLVLEFRDSSVRGPDPAAEEAGPLLPQVIADARELLTGVDQYSEHCSPLECGGAEKLCAAALALHGVCECAIEGFVQASVSYDDKREFWGSLANSPWLLAAHSFVYCTSRSSIKARQLEQELCGLVDECALCAGSLQLFLQSVAAAVQRHNKAAYTHNGDASVALLKRNQGKLRADLAAAILELRHCFSGEFRVTAGTSSQTDIVVDDRDATAVTKGWCAEAAAIVDAVHARYIELHKRIDSTEFGTGGKNWRKLVPVGCVCLATMYAGFRFLSEGREERGGPGVREQIALAIESGREFFVLHLLTPLEHIYAELLMGAGASKAALATAPLVDASAAALDDMLAAWRISHLETVSRAKGTLVAAELAKLPVEALAAQSYREQSLTPLRSVLRGSLVELMMVQKEQLQLDVLRTLGKTDELMRANQINMEVSALAPALLGLAGFGYGLIRVCQWLAHAAVTLLPHSRHENSRAIELRWQLSKPRKFYTEFAM